MISTHVLSNISPNMNQKVQQIMSTIVDNYMVTDL